MKHFIALLLLESLAFSQGLPMGAHDGSAVISYCASVGYPTSPTVTSLAYRFEADCITFPSSVCNSPADGTVITTWADQSGNGFNASKVAGNVTLHTNQLNGKPAVTMDGAQNWTISGIGPGGNKHTLFVVYKLASTSNGALVGGSASGQLEYYTNTNQNIFQTGAAPDIGHGSTTMSTGTWYSGMVAYAGHNAGFSLAFLLNQATDTAVVLNNNLNTSSPNKLFFDGIDNCCNWSSGNQLAALIYYQDVLSAGDQQLDTCYLYGKYGR